MNLKTLKHPNGNHEGYQVQTLQATFGFSQIIVKFVEKFESKLKTFAKLPIKSPLLMLLPQSNELQKLKIRHIIVKYKT